MRVSVPGITYRVPNHSELASGLDLRRAAVGTSYQLLKTKNGRADPLPFANPSLLNYFLLTVFFSSAPGVNFATLRAAILIVAPV